MLHKLGFDKENVYEDLRASVRCAPQVRSVAVFHGVADTQYENADPDPTLREKRIRNSDMRRVF